MTPSVQVADTSRARFCGMRRTPDLASYERDALVRSIDAAWRLKHAMDMTKHETFQSLEAKRDPPYGRLMAIAGLLAIALAVLLVAIVLAVG